MSTFDGEKLQGLRAQFQRDGYLILPGYFSPEQVDSLRAEVSRLLVERPFEIVTDSHITGQRAWLADTPYRETERHKVNDLYLISEVVREFALGASLGTLLSALLQEPAVLCNSLYLGKGSTDPRHIDSLYMTPRTPHALAASWTALEDVHPDAGPLTYFPGSHLIPLYRFSDGTHHSIREEMTAWDAYIGRELKARGIEEKVFLGKKGDVFIWHSDLLHTGSAIRDMRRTRSSLVCHYFVESDTRAQGCELVPQPGGYWMRRLHQPVLVSPRVFEAGRPFPEEQYLARYPDVKAGVAAGYFTSGFHHYEVFGFKEGRGI